MDGRERGSGGVSLSSGSAIFGGDSLLLVSGARQWRIRIPSAQESEDNLLVVEVKQGNGWIVAHEYVVTAT